MQVSWDAFHTAHFVELAKWVFFIPLLLAYNGISQAKVSGEIKKV